MNFSWRVRSFMDVRAGGHTVTYYR